MPFGKLMNIQGSRAHHRLPLLFECLLCHDKYTVEDIRKKKFFVETSICRKCYTAGLAINAKVWCFGKLPRHNSPGYSLENVSCRLLCPDRSICKRFINKQKEK
jgi:hypothetical protein